MNSSPFVSQLVGLLLVPAAFVLTALFGDFVISFYRYFDMGAGGGALFVIVLYCPLVCCALLLVGLLVYVALVNRSRGPWVSLLLTSTLMLALTCGAAAAEVFLKRNYPVAPSDVPHRLPEFLSWYFHSFRLPWKT